MTKAAMKRFKASKFFHEVTNVVYAWDFYLKTGKEEMANEMMHKWEMAKLALEYITGKVYGFSRNGETYSIVNERDYNDRLFFGHSVAVAKKEKETVSQNISGGEKL
jgi:hypothetical protein